LYRLLLHVLCYRLYTDILQGYKNLLFSHRNKYDVLPRFFRIEFFILSRNGFLVYWYTRIIVITIIIILFVTIFIERIYDYTHENKPQVYIILQIFCSYDLLNIYCYFPC